MKVANLPVEWNRKEWEKVGTKNHRQYLATLSPLAWVLEYRPLSHLPGVGDIEFEPYWAQQNFLNDQSPNRILNKMRQGGFSTVESAAEVPWKAIYRNSPSIITLSKNGDDAIGFHDKFKLAYHSVSDKDPNYKTVKSLTKTSTGENLSFKVLNAGKGSGRSFSATDVYFDEMPHAQYSDEIYTSSYPTITRTGGRFTLFSSPLGKGNKFYEICTNHNQNGYSYHQYEWWFVPAYNPVYKEFITAYLAGDQKEVDKLIKIARQGDWYKNTVAALGELAFAQEFECNFDAASDAVFSQRQLDNVFRKNYLKMDAEDYGTVYRMELDQDLIESMDFVTAADYGRKRDPTIIGTFGYFEEEGRWRLVEVKRITPLEFEFREVVASFRRTIAHYQSDAYHDGTGNGDVFTVELEGESSPISFASGNTSKLKNNAIDNLKRCMDNKAMILPDIPFIKKEFEQYMYNDKKLVQDTVMMVLMAILKAYDPQEAFVGFDQSYSFTGQ